MMFKHRKGQRSKSSNFQLYQNNIFILLNIIQHVDDDFMYMDTRASDLSFKLGVKEIIGKPKPHPKSAVWNCKAMWQPFKPALCNLTNVMFHTSL